MGQVFFTAQVGTSTNKPGSGEDFRDGHVLLQHRQGLPRKNLAALSANKVSCRGIVKKQAGPFLTRPGPCRARRALAASPRNGHRTNARAVRAELLAEEPQSRPGTGAEEGERRPLLKRRQARHAAPSPSKAGVVGSGMTKSLGFTSAYCGPVVDQELNPS